MTDTMLCIRGGEVRAMAVVADDDIYRETIAEWIADPATEAILKVDVETARTAFLRPAADLMMANLVGAVEAVGQRTPPPPSTHVALPQDVIDLVIAAREALQYLYGMDGCELRSLDKAVEAFAERVPHENEPAGPEVSEG